MNKNKICFVIMGFGVKTDLATGRELNLDKTYKHIIKPAAEGAGLECIRADEIRHSGVIDVPMYEMLINADVVIADLSTNNSNAFYELGVRHALRPKTTIAIAENKLKPPFDVDHTIIHKYAHLGVDIGYEEVLRFKNDLVETIKEITTSENIDSPVYTFLKDLQHPILKKEKEKEKTIIIDDEKSFDTLGDLIECAMQDMHTNNFIEAIAKLEKAKSINQYDEYILQKLALATYKSKYPDHITALNKAWDILQPLNPDVSTDPESLGISGAIHKRLWEELNNKKYLNKSISYYEKGFYIKNDYYNGINLAFLYNEKACIEEDSNQAITDFILAERTREKVILICQKIREIDIISERSDKYWIAATLEEAYFGLNDSKNYHYNKEIAKSLSTNNWERETTESQISKLNELLKSGSILQ